MFPYTGQYSHPFKIKAPKHIQLRMNTYYLSIELSIDGYGGICLQYLSGLDLAEPKVQIQETFTFSAFSLFQTS